MATELTVVKSWTPTDQAPPPDQPPTSGFNPTPSESAMLGEIRRRESSENYGAHNPDSTASGAYQFINSTWRETSQHTGVPMYATAAQAPKDVQDVNALYMLRKYGPNASQTWEASGPYSTSKGSAARSEPATDSGPAPAASPSNTAPSGVSGSPVDDLISRLAGGENIDVTPQLIAQIIRDRPTVAPAPAAEAEAPLTVVKSWDASPPVKPAELSPAQKTGWAFVQGLDAPHLLSPALSVLDLIQGKGLGPTLAAIPGQAQGVAQSFANELPGWTPSGGFTPGRALTEWGRTGESAMRLLRGDFSDPVGTLYHLFGSIPLAGGALQQIADKIGQGDPAAATGLTGAFLVQVLGPGAAEEVAPRIVPAVERAATAVKESPIGRATIAAAPDVAKGGAKMAAGTAMAKVPVPEVLKFGTGLPLVGAGAKQVVAGLRKGVAEFKTAMVEGAEAAPEAAPPAAPESAPAPAAAPTPGQAYAQSQGVDWSTLGPVDRQQMENIARARANVASQPPTPQAPAAPPLTPQDLTELETGRPPSRQSEAAQQTAAETLATTQAAAPPAAPAAPEAQAAAAATPPAPEAPTGPLAAKPKAAAIAQQLEEVTRPDRISGFLKANFADLTPEDIDKLDPHDWELIGQGAGGKAPTAEQIAEVKANLAPVPREVAKMAPAEAKAAVASKLQKKPALPAPTAAQARVEAFAQHFAKDTGITPEAIASIADNPEAAGLLEELGRSLKIKGKPAPGEIQKIADRVRELRRAGRKPQ